MTGEQLAERLNKAMAEEAYQLRGGKASAGAVAGLSAESPCASNEAPGMKQLLFEAAERHQEKAEAFRTLAKLLPDNDALNYESRRNLRNAIEELVRR